MKCSESWGWLCRIGIFISFAVFVCGPLYAEEKEDDQNWRASITGLYLQEEVGGGGEDLFFYDNNDDETLNNDEPQEDTDDVLSDWGDPLTENVGWRAEIGYLPPDQCGVSLAYLTRRAQKTETYNSPGEDLMPRFNSNPYGITGPLPDFEEAGQVVLDYETNLQQVELMFHSYVCRPTETLSMRARVGPVISWLDDDFEIRGFDDFPAESDPLDRSDLYVDTENTMYGIQVGGQAQLQVTSFLNLLGDLGVGPYYAEMKMDTEFREFDGDEDRWSSDDSERDWGLMTDANLSAEFVIHENVRLRLGYMAMWRSHTARAINQIKPGEGIDADLADTRFPELESDSTLYHGALIAVEARF